MDSTGQKSSEQSEIYSETEQMNISKISKYTYDRLGRLMKETRTGSDDISYTYDAHNNRKKMKSGNQVTAYRYNKNDELLRTDTLNADTEQNSVALYKNYNNGNQLAEVKRQSTESKGETYFNLDVSIGGNRLNENVVNHYNALNELTETLTKNTKVSYEYDAEGLRTKKTVNGETITYVWDGDQLVMELDDKGDVLKRYIRGTSLIYSDRGDETGRQYYVMNPHGDVVQLLNQSGEVIKTYEYDSFGNEVNPDKDDDNPFRYSGEYYDKETESIYLRARYYQPGVARFLTRDTYTGEDDDPLSLNLYTYCGNDGVNNVDPSGHFFETVLDIFSLGDSVYQMVEEPSLENGAYLLWDTASLFPCVPGSYVSKGTKAVKVMDSTGQFRKVIVKVKKVGKSVGSKENWKVGGKRCKEGRKGSRKWCEEGWQGSRKQCKESW